jgi:hypothetical protein
MPLDAPEQPTEETALTVKQEQFITSLLAGNSIQVAARAASVNEKTADRWLKLSHVQKALRDAQRAIFEAAVFCIISDVSEARATLRGIMTNTEVPATTRVRAAQILLEQAIALRKANEMEARIAALEARMEQ